MQVEAKITNVDALSQKLNMLCFYFDRALIDTTYPSFTNIQCGRAVCDKRLNMLGDDTGVNISERNSYWSEMTGLYWAWLNIEKVDFVGLCSYRRFFNYKKDTVKPVIVANSTAGQAMIRESTRDFDPNIFKEYDIITPVPYVYPCSIRDSWAKNYNINDLEILGEAIQQKSPCYLDAYLHYIGGNKILGHNMFVMDWARFRHFCEWVFGLLLDIEGKINPARYPRDRQRVFGYMHEILLGVYIARHKLRPARSQIIWINEDLHDTYFNKITYQAAANVAFSLRKLWSKMTFSQM